MARRIKSFSEAVGALQVWVAVADGNGSSLLSLTARPQHVWLADMPGGSAADIS
jgi:hypothetical protein